MHFCDITKGCALCAASQRGQEFTGLIPGVFKIQDLLSTKCLGFSWLSHVHVVLLLFYRNIAHINEFKKKNKTLNVKDIKPPYLQNEMK